MCNLQIQARPDHVGNYAHGLVNHYVEATCAICNRPLLSRSEPLFISRHFIFTHIARRTMRASPLQRPCLFNRFTTAR